MWPTVTIERRYVHPILEGIKEDGLVQSQWRTSMKKITPPDLRWQAQAMLREKKMPSLEVVLAAVAEVREKYSEQIKARRKHED
jgi:hypothetical protein